ncbi:hypothetical protein [Haliangium sp.]|uniref:hypothetical protein n=1 Tax=Haliangium sp. TaxID=2663208 RepID=UPI003D0B2458
MHRIVTRLLLCAAAALVLAALTGPVGLTPTALAAQEGGAAVAEGAGAEPYHSAMRPQCEDELIKDATWRAELKQQLTPEIHQEDANQMLTNRYHVVMAYALLWIVMLGFVVFMWVRQRGLSAEIARLERELAEAAKD